jgi:spore maturation protein CgeB
MPAVFWPLASDETLFAPEKGATKDIDILFVGNRYGIRGSLVQYLEKNGLSVTCYGGGWPNGYVDAERNIDLSKRAKIILGVGTIGHCSDLYTLKLRDFDALMTGALYITHRNPDLLQIFNEGEHLECYENAGELLRKLRYYLAHPDEAEKIGLKSTGLSRQKHSWYYRLVTTFTRLELVT